MRFLIDEDLPRSLAAALREEAFGAEDVRDVGLRGRHDDHVFARAQSGGLVLVSGDLGFSNILRYPPGSHAGIVIARFPTRCRRPRWRGPSSRAFDRCPTTMSSAISS
jgi:predicted nuclease of predicted toxin-antitoxin system